MGARALADFGGLIQGAWIGGFEVCDPVNGWVVRGGGDGFGGMASRGCGGEQGWIERFTVSGGRGGVQAGGGAGGEHRESGCEDYTVRVHCLQADGKLVGDGDELCWAGQGAEGWRTFGLGCGGERGVLRQDDQERWWGLGLLGAAGSGLEAPG